MSSLEKQKIRNLVFFVDQDFGDSLIDEVEAFVLKLASSREWLLGPPLFVYEVEEVEEPNGVDETAYTLGGLFRLYSSFAPEKLPLDVERIHLEEVKEIVRQVQDFSAEKKVIFMFELDHDAIGQIERGKVDRSLREGLLEEWEKSLQEDEGRG